jgi:Flp pilus assembly protein TadD
MYWPSLDADGGDTAAAEQQMREVIKLRPNELSRRTRLAVYLARQRRLDDAQQVPPYRTLVRDSPSLYMPRSIATAAM